MILKKLLAYATMLIAYHSFSQAKNFYYDIQPTKSNFYQSHYSSVQFLDSRKNKTCLGSLVAYQDLSIPVISNHAIDEQFYHLFDALIASVAEKNSLLVELRNFNFSQSTTYLSCSIRIQLYAVNNGLYRKVNFLDTIFLLEHNIKTVKSNEKARDKLYDTCNQIITDFFGRTLDKSPAHEIDFSIGYKEADVLNMENIEKSSMPLYRNNGLKDGLYVDYESFKNQKPGDTIFKVKEKDTTITDVYDRNGDTFEKPQLYAVVYKGRAYISTELGYYPLYKMNNDFFFSGKMRFGHYSPVSGGLAVHTAGIFIFGLGSIGASALGLLGTLAGPSTITSKYKMEVQVDYVNGGFILLKVLD